MIPAIGWRLCRCSENHLHIELLAKDGEALAELVLEDLEDIWQFEADVKETIEGLKEE